MKFSLLLCFISFSAFCQDTLFNVHDTVSIAPGGATRSIRGLPYYVVPVTDPRLREPSMGMNVLNMLRGQVPGIALTPQFVTVDPSNLTAFLVVDGAPVNSTITNYSSLNTFDYQSPTVISGNATTYYGMYGTGNGGVLLNSRSGEGAYRGQFSFNTFNTTGWEKALSNNFSPGQALTSNSLAYAKDFGRVDLRVSGNYTLGSGQDNYSGAITEIGMKNLNLKLNTGWNITSKLKARIILEKNSDKRTSEIKAFSAFPDNKSHFGYTSSRANLNVDYEAASWLRFSTRLQKSSIDNDYKDQRYPFSPVVPLVHDRNLFNLFANFDKHVTDNIAISASTGYQRDKGTDAFAYRINSQMNSVGIRFRDQLFVDGNFRIDNSNIDPQANNKKTWSVSSGWVFTDLWKSRPAFTYGKLRASFGRYSYVTIPYYPQASLTSDGRVLESAIDNSKQYHRYELGTDLLFWKGRIQVTANYIRFSSDLMSSVSTIKQGPLTITFLDHTRYFSDVQQLAVGAYLNGKKTEFTKLTLTTGRSKKQTPPDRARNLTEGKPYQIDLRQTNTVGDLVINVLIEGYSVTRKENIWGIRELSLSYSLMKGFAQRRSVDPAAISLIGRGFMSKDESKFATNGMARSISLGFTVNF